MRYTKPALTLAEQVAYLRDKNLVIPDEKRATRYLATIGLFRLKSYAPPFFENGTSEFRAGTTFEDLLALYVFDRKLRLLALDALDRIEIAVRSAISNVMSEQAGPHWFLECTNFSNNFVSRKGRDGKTAYEHLVQTIRHATRQDPKTGHPDCQKYHANFCEPDVPPSWIVAEVLTMGTWSKLYPAIGEKRYRRQIAKRFGFRHDDLAGWIHELTNLRNHCAHHQRVWNRTLAPRAKNVANYTHKGIKPHTPYAKFAMIYAFLCSFTHDSGWNQKFYELVGECPVDIYAVSKFPRRWETEKFWRVR